MTRRSGLLALCATTALCGNAAPPLSGSAPVRPSPIIPAAPVAARTAIQGAWDMAIPGTGRRFLLVLQASATSPDPLNGALMLTGQMLTTTEPPRVIGGVQGFMDPYSRNVRYTLSSTNGPAASGLLVLSADGNSLSGEQTYAGGGKFTWSGTRAK